MLFAKFWGASEIAEAFFIAFRIPEFMRKVFSSGAITQIVSPHIDSKQSNIDNTKFFIISILTIISLVMLLIIILFTIFSKDVIYIFANGIASNQSLINLSSNLFIIMTPYSLFIFLVSLISAVLNSYDKYLITSILPATLNIFIILGILLSSKLSIFFNISIYSVAYSVLLAGIFQLFISLLALKSIFKYLKITKKSFKNKNAKQFFKKLPIAFIGASSLQLNLIIETFFASFLISGSIAWLYYADRVNQFVYTIFGTAISIVIIPKLMKLKDKKKLFYKQISITFKLCFLIVIPAVIGLIFLSKEIITTLFYYGNFSILDIQNTRLALIGYSISLFCFVIIRFLISVLYVNNQVSKVFKINIFCLLLNFILDSLIICFFKNYNNSFFIISCITSILSFINMLILMILVAELNFQNFYKMFVDIIFILKVFIAVIIMAIFLYFIDITNFLTIKNIFLRAFYLFFEISLAVIVYLALLIILKIRNNIKL